ncbi:UDP-N-acetylmuramate dehydrogenase [Bacillus sp. RG28]|uniref:UDP-N-acetylenolpyruvoylglucosamine reductase n=1 Tax=Gottfriedia endophytica TaxID=2820819 RepID=A0A940NUC3_9BACI|nr:UDP-N-acetylmuramate dehydrogenase [Gottfriedia endophytica]MBP0726926.1 UDP-N-acetylmuramate dehydrogenase [Gottfriedia endophytica]
MLNNKVLQKIVEIVSEENVKLDEILKNHTATKLGGKADYFVTPTTVEQVKNIVTFAKEHSIPLLLIGNGSNMVVKDGGFRGIVLNLKKFNNLTINENRMVVQSGVSIIEASRKALEANLTGLEFACGIPGSIGGALAMNAGAYGGEIQDIIVSTVVISPEGEVLTLSKEELELGYRKSIIAKKGYIALEATFQLEKGNYKEIKEKMDDLTQKREEKQPLEYPSAGSVFKRPPGHFAGKLIQDSGLQGTNIGGAEVSLKHAGFIINKDNATATDYINLINHVQEVVKEKFGIELEREVKIVGEDL